MVGKEKNSGGAHRNVHVTSTSNMVAYWYGQIKGFPGGSHVTTAGSDGPRDETGRSAGAGRPALLWVVIVLLAAEFLLVAATAVFLVVELLVARPDSYPSAVAIVVLTVLATVWLGSIVLGALRGRAWIRGAAIVWQVLQFAVGFGSLQGVFADPAIGVALIVPAVAVVGLLLVPSVVAATSARDQEPHVY